MKGLKLSLKKENSNGDKLIVLLVLLICLTSEIMLMLGMACALANGRIFLAVIAMFGLHYHAVIVSDCFKRLI